MKHVKNLKNFMINESMHSVYDVFVVMTDNDTDIDKIYLNRSDADNACIKAQEDIKKYSHLSHLKYKVYTLSDAISVICQNVRREEEDNY